MINDSSLLCMVRNTKLPYYEVLSGKQADPKQVAMTEKVQAINNRYVSLNFYFK